jgi:transposase-like protein
VRAGSAPSWVTLSGRRVEVPRLRARTTDGRELVLPSFASASALDPLDHKTMESIAVGVSTRKYARNLDALPSSDKQRSVSKSAVSRRFVALTQRKLERWLARSLDELDLRVVIIDGKIFRGHCVLIAQGIDSSGKKHVLGLREGTTENATVAKALLTDLIERGLSTDHAVLFVIDGSKALRKAIRQVYGELGVVQRCQEHKRRNVLEHLPECMRASVERVLRQAWDLSDARAATRQLENLARSLEREHPGAAASVREGLEETLTLQRLGVQGTLYRTLRTTNTIENLNGSVAHYTRNVKRWRGGSMIVRWVCAALIEAEKSFRRVRGYRDIDRLVATLDAMSPSVPTAKEAA